MRRYDVEDERRARLRRAVRDWTNSGLLSDAQGRAVASTLETPLKSGGLLFRIVLAAFTAVIVFAATGLLFVFVAPRGEAAGGLLVLAVGVACFAAADYAARVHHLYRYGIEEALAAAAVAGGGIGTALVLGSSGALAHGDAPLVAALVVGAAVSALAYQRFGLLYQAIAGIAFVACVPLVVSDLALPTRHLGAAAVCAVVFAAPLRFRPLKQSDTGIEDGPILEAASVAGAYLALNLHTGWLQVTWQPAPVAPWFYWLTYAATWALPALAIRRGIASRNRALLDVGIATALVSLLTNKAYLGWPRQTWDPMLLGALLVAVALGVRRWLASGPGGARAGFTPTRLLASDEKALALASTISVTVQPQAQTPPARDTTSFGGGRSGGGGGGAEW